MVTYPAGTPVSGQVEYWGELGGGSKSHADETPVVDRQEATTTSSLDHKEEFVGTGQRGGNRIGALTFFHFLSFFDTVL